MAQIHTREQKMEKIIADIEKYDPKPDKKLIEGLYRRLAGVMGRADSRTVAMSDPKEVATIRNGFIKKTLGVDKRDKADQAIESVRDMMKKDRSKSRMTTYYLLAKELKKASALK